MKLGFILHSRSSHQLPCNNGLRRAFRLDTASTLKFSETESWSLTTPKAWKIFMPRLVRHGVDLGQPTSWIGWAGCIG